MYAHDEAEVKTVYSGKHIELIDGSWISSDNGTGI
jgi:hypothetical protein